jgi:two-component system, NtrC family, response regulator AlgB
MNLACKPTEITPVTKNEKPVAGRILAIDDDRELLENFSMCLSKEGYRVTTAETVEEGIRLAATLPFQVCLLDRNIGYDSGLDALPKLRELAPLMRVIMVTGHSGVNEAIDAIAQGASDYLVKPCSPEQLRIAVARQVDTRRMIDRLDTLEREVGSETPQLNSKNDAMRAAISLALQVAGTDANVLLRKRHWQRRDCPGHTRCQQSFSRVIGHGELSFAVGRAA